MAAVTSREYALLQWMAKVDMDWNLKYTELGQLFQVLMLCMQNSPNKVLLLVLPDENCLMSSSYRKIPKISPSTYKPPKLVTQKTLR